MLRISTCPGSIDGTLAEGLIMMTNLATIARWLPDRRRANAETVLQP